MRSEFRWATATKGSERERPLSEVREPGSTGLLPQATITPRPQFWLPGGSLDPDGGTAARLAASECPVLAKAARAKELENFIQ